MAMVLRTILYIFTAGNKEEETQQKGGHITSILLLTSVSAIVFAFFEEESYFHPNWLFSSSQYRNALLIIFGLLMVALLNGFHYVSLPSTKPPVVSQSPGTIQCLL